MRDLARYRGRSLRNSIWMTLALLATVVGLGMLVLILGGLLWRGFSSLTPAVFLENTPPPGSSGGLLNAIVGSLLMTIFGVLVGAPLGIFAGTYLAEYGRAS